MGRLCRDLVPLSLMVLFFFLSITTWPVASGAAAASQDQQREEGVGAAKSEVRETIRQCCNCCCVVNCAVAISAVRSVFRLPSSPAFSVSGPAPRGQLPGFSRQWRSFFLRGVLLLLLLLLLFAATICVSSLLCVCVMDTACCSSLFRLLVCVCLVVPSAGSGVTTARRSVTANK